MTPGPSGAFAILLDASNWRGPVNRTGLLLLLRHFEPIDSEWRRQMTFRCSASSVAVRSAPEFYRLRSFA